MNKLDKEQHHTILPLLSMHKAVPTFVYSAVLNMLPGKIWVDTYVKPSVALIELDMGLFYVIGEEQNLCFIDYLLEKVRINNKRLTLFSSSQMWDETINTFFDKELNSISRYSYQYQVESYQQHINFETFESRGYTLKRINRNVIQRSKEFTEQYYREYWGSIDYFENNGFGFCIEYNEQIVCECTSIFSNKMYAEMDIVTLEEFRGQGLGYIAAIAFINQALKSKVIPRWDCNEDNVASRDMARKLSFENPVRYTVFFKKW